MATLNKGDNDSHNNNNRSFAYFEARDEIFFRPLLLPPSQVLDKIG